MVLVKKWKQCGIQAAARRHHAHSTPVKVDVGITPFSRLQQPELSDPRSRNQIANMGCCGSKEQRLALSKDKHAIKRAALLKKEEQAAKRAL